MATRTHVAVLCVHTFAMATDIRGLLTLKSWGRIGSMVSPAPYPTVLPKPSHAVMGTSLQRLYLSC